MIPPRKRGRPITTGTTPPKDRKAKERANIAQDGGGRLNINLTPEAAADLSAILASKPGTNRTAATHEALRAYRAAVAKPG